MLLSYHFEILFYDFYLIGLLCFSQLVLVMHFVTQNINNNGKIVECKIDDYPLMHWNPNSIPKTEQES